MKKKQCFVDIKDPINTGSMIQCRLPAGPGDDVCKRHRRLGNEKRELREARERELEKKILNLEGQGRINDYLLDGAQIEQRHFHNLADALRKCGAHSFGPMKGPTCDYEMEGCPRNECPITIALATIDARWKK